MCGNPDFTLQAVSVSDIEIIGFGLFLNFLPTGAGMIGATLGSDEAYRVSRGETVTSFSGFKIKLIRPLDFIVVADHAENLGIAEFIRRSDPIILANERFWSQSKSQYQVTDLNVEKTNILVANQ